MRYEIKPSHLASPVFLTPPGESSGAFPPLAVVLAWPLALSLPTVWRKYPVSWRLSMCSVFVTHIYTHIKRREESGDVSSRLNLGENVLLRTRSNKEMTSQLLFRVRQ
jgi:hypothetical protein